MSEQKPSVYQERATKSDWPPYSDRPGQLPATDIARNFPTRNKVDTPARLPADDRVLSSVSAIYLLRIFRLFTQ
jgi:hypothetical protein